MSQWNCDFLLCFACNITFRCRIFTGGVKMWYYNGARLQWLHRYIRSKAMMLEGNSLHCCSCETMCVIDSSSCCSLSPEDSDTTSEASEISKGGMRTIRLSVLSTENMCSLAFVFVRRVTICWLIVEKKLVVYYCEISHLIGGP